MVMIRQLSMGPDLEIQISGDENAPAARNGLMTAVNVGGEPDEIS